MTAPQCQRNLWWLTGGLLLLLAGVGYGLLQLRNPQVSLLVDRDGARWICPRDPVLLTALYREVYVVCFRKSFVLNRPLGDSRLYFQAFRDGALKLDGRLITLPLSQPAAWQQTRTVILPAAVLTSGTHELRFAVRNTAAPAALRVWSPDLAMASGKDWETSLDQKSWQRAELATQAKLPDLSREFPAPLTCLLRLSPILLPLFLVVFLVTLYRERVVPRAFGLFCKERWQPSAVRWALVGFWLVLATNNLLKLPAHVGFDVTAHLDYIRWLLEKRTLPLAPDGWQMFQPPFYYLLSAPFYSLFSLVMTPGPAALLLRLLPLACGALQVQLVYLALRRVFPGRPDLQIAGLLTAGLLPMNLYLCQYIGNEPLAAVLTGAAFYCLIRVDAAREAPRPTGLVTARRTIMMAAVFLGLALLTKMTPLVLLPLFLGYLVWQLRQYGASWRQTLLLAAGFCGVILLISGGFYLRNWWVLGKPLVGGWESQALPWWQHPGYRTPGQLFRFGEVFRYPVYAATVSFGNGLYSTLWADGYLSSMITLAGRPPWNYGFMLAGVLLGVLPAAAILLGLGAACAGYGGNRRPVLLLATGGVILLLAAMLHLFLTVPIYSTVKASYSSGLTVAYAVLAATGYDLLTRSRWGAAVVYGWLACWTVTAMAAYFIL